MARKHKTSRVAKAQGPKEFDSKESKIDAIHTWEDVADEEDQFHISRDKVLLEDGGVGRRGEDDFAPSDEEVMALSGADEGGDDEDDDSEDDDDDTPSKRAQPEDDSDSEIDDGRRKNKDEDLEGWGTSKKNYYGGNEIETEQDAVDEEAEAKRLQTKQLEAMNEADFIFDEEEWATGGDEKEPKVGKIVITEALPTTIPESMSVEERTGFFKARHPEFEPLAKEFTDLQSTHTQLSLSAAAAEAVGETAKTSVAIAKFRILSAYLGMLSMYFALLTSPGMVETQGIGMKDHPVMEGLVKCREMWNGVKDLEVEEIRSSPRAGGENVDIDVEEKVGEGALVVLPKSIDKVESKDRKRKRAKLDEDLPPSKTKTSAKSLRTEDSLAALPLLTKIFTAKPKAKPTTAATTQTKLQKTSTLGAYDDDDFGEDTHLTALDAEEKAARRKSLRFYTSQITSKSSKRSQASRRAGGDIDVPHKERRKEKELRLAAEAAKRRAAGEGADLDSDDPSESDKRVAKELQEPDSDLEYYNLIADTAKKRREQKKEVYEAMKKAEREGHAVSVVEGEIGPDGKRAVGYTIEKNKGLAPHRKKEVRNPRVKKRKRYEAAKKKLASKKAVWKGGQQGPYGGEVTGINKNVVKSIKFA